MSLTLARTKRWGNSLGLIIPGNVVNELHLKENQEIEILIRPKLTAAKILSKFKPLKFSKSAQELKDEARRELW